MNTTTKKIKPISELVKTWDLATLMNASLELGFQIKDWKSEGHKASQMEEKYNAIVNELKSRI